MAGLIADEEESGGDEDESEDSDEQEDEEDNEPEMVSFENRNSLPIKDIPKLMSGQCSKKGI